MAVVVVKSGVITNRDASPRVFNNPGAACGTVKGFQGTGVVTNGNSVGSTYLFGSIPSNAVMRSLNISSPDIGTTTTMDVGLYKTTDDGSAVVDADFFTAAVVLNAGAIAESNILHGNVITLANGEKRIWELLGLASDPGIMYDVVGTLAGAADATGTVLVKGSYAL
jgi:hypothetical protein